MLLAGKGNEDKRGQSVGLGIEQRSWLYLNGHPVVCNCAMEVAAIVSAINPAINASMDSVELGCLQQVSQLSPRRWLLPFASPVLADKLLAFVVMWSPGRHGLWLHLPQLCRESQINEFDEHLAHG